MPEWKRFAVDDDDDAWRFRQPPHARKAHARFILSLPPGRRIRAYQRSRWLRNKAGTKSPIGGDFEDSLLVDAVESLGAASHDEILDSRWRSQLSIQQTKEN